jgi:hypothetical protein
MIRDDHDSFIDNPSTLYLQVKKAISDLASKEGVDIAHRACASALQPLIEKEIYLTRWKYSRKPLNYKAFSNINSSGLALMDHVRSFINKENYKLALRLEPYQADMDELQELIVLCKANGLTFTITGQSPWFLGNTVAIWITNEKLDKKRDKKEDRGAMIKDRVHELALPAVLPPPKPAPSAPRIPYECQVVQHFEYHLDAVKEAKERKKKEPDKLYGYAFDPAAQKWAVILCSSFPKTKSAKLIEGLVVITMPDEEEEEFFSEPTQSLLNRYNQIIDTLSQLLAAGKRRGKTFYQGKGAAWEIYRQLQDRGINVNPPPD